VVSKKTAIVVNNGKGAKAFDLDANSVVKIKAVSGLKYILNSEGDLGPENLTLTRVGDDLQLTLEGADSPALVLEGYYSLAEPPGLFGIAEDGQLYAYTRTDGVPGLFSLADGSSEPIALGGDPLGAGAPYLAPGDDDSFGLLPLLLLGGLAAGAAIAALSQSNSKPALAANPEAPSATTPLTA